MKTKFKIKDLYNSAAATKCDRTVNITNSKIGNEENDTYTQAEYEKFSKQSNRI